MLRILCLAILCLPALGSFLISLSPSKAAGVVDRRPIPPLVFEQYLVDLKDFIAPDERHVFARFDFRNRGDVPLHIESVRPTCGCLSVRMAKQDYQPGERGMFALQLDTAGESPGPKELYADVTYRLHGSEESELHTEQVTFRAILPRKKISVRPRALIFYQFSEQETDQLLTITDFRGHDLQVTEATVDSEFVSVVKGATGRTPEGFSETKVNVTVRGKIPPGKHQAQVILKTNDATYPEVKVPLIIQGPPVNMARQLD